MQNTNKINAAERLKEDETGDYSAIHTPYFKHEINLREGKEAETICKRCG